MSEDGDGYRRPRFKRPPNLKYKVEVQTNDRGLAVLDFETIHPWQYEFDSLPQMLVGEVDQGLADPTGSKSVKIARLYMKHLLVGIKGIHPDELVEVNGDTKAYLDLEGNEDLAYMGYLGFHVARAGAYTKSGNEDSDEAPSGGDGIEAAGVGGGASVPGVRGRDDSAGNEPGEALQAGTGV